MAKLVLDISKWDPDIDLQAWKTIRGLWGVIIKAGGNEGGRYTDSSFDRHYKLAREAGLHIGFYYYTTVTTSSEAELDAKHFIDIVDDRFYDLPWYMDVEDKRQFNLSPRNLTDVIKSFCNTLIANGRYAGLYTGGDAWLHKMYRNELSDYANWIAWWREKWPTDAGEIGMWQQGGMRLSDGDIVYDDVSGYVDLDWCDVDYPSRINSGWTKQQTETDSKPSEKNQNGSEAIGMGRASDVINVAYGELGYYAPDDPEPGSRYGRWLADLTGENWLRGPSWEIYWCCCFASYCLSKGGVKMDGFPTQNTDLALNGGARKYAIDKYKVQYGDIVIFNWDWDNKTDHIGFATSEFDGSGFSTIEGNVGNAVKECYRQMGNVAYVLRPPYEGYGVVSENVPSVSDAPKNNRDGGKLDVDGLGGWNTVIDLQHIFGVEEDGVISGQNPKTYDANWGMCGIEYGRGGSVMVSKLQKCLGVPVNGQWGFETSKALQQKLADAGYAIDVDSYFGTASVKVLQQAINDRRLPEILGLVDNKKE